MQRCVVITSVAAADLSGQVGFREDLETDEKKRKSTSSRVCACSDGEPGQTSEKTAGKSTTPVLRYVMLRTNIIKTECNDL